MRYKCRGPGLYFFCLSLSLFDSSFCGYSCKNVTKRTFHILNSNYIFDLTSRKVWFRLQLQDFALTMFLRILATYVLLTC